ncbi:MAG TPA: hypothetical protein VFA61_09355 [Candidatus Udaeobacter sp.]|nr:hypothetical protein [Candidatus Udaeobacter sp.]
MRFRYVILGYLFLGAIGCLASGNSAQGFLQGHLRILPFKDVELAEGNPPKFSGGNYAEYPLIILSRNGKKEIARITADEEGNYRLALPPGDYILNVQGRQPKGHVRVKPQPFTVISNQIARVNMDIDTGIR